MDEWLDELNGPDYPLLDIEDAVEDAVKCLQDALDILKGEIEIRQLHGEVASTLRLQETCGLIEEVVARADECLKPLAEDIHEEQQQYYADEERNSASGY